MQSFALLKAEVSSLDQDELEHSKIVITDRRNQEKKGMYLSGEASHLYWQFNSVRFCKTTTYLAHIRQSKSRQYFYNSFLKLLNREHVENAISNIVNVDFTDFRKDFEKISAIYDIYDVLT